MNIIYSDHTERRLKQRGITKLEIEHIIKYPFYRVIEIENYIKIITVI